jgi:molecular chaperone DnaK (HSP70)
LALDEKQFIVGIDLGTTNSAVSYVDLKKSEAKQRHIKIFEVPQLTGPGEVSSLPVLPSFLYIPGEYDISKEAIALPWETDETNFAGAFARDQGAKIPARLVSSAKSWLCHDKVDRNARILPWGADAEVFKVSPVQATASYLKHIKKAWNASKGDDADLYLENQMVVITVPASFDEVARDLTVEAAQSAGLTRVTLLEEPLAAFYSWLIRHEQDWSDHVKPDDLILVCDVGGGTTDFTLIALRETDGSPRFERIAVGDHLILGGDNIDLALARRVELGLGRDKPPLKGNRWKALCHQCRQAKEKILNGYAESEKITLMGEGRELIAGTISAELKREELEETLLEGFFPFVAPETIKRKMIKKGITEFGLPYEAEPAITRHLGWFLEHHREDVAHILNKDPIPDLVLFNGGSLKPVLVRERIRSAIRYWFKQENTEIPGVLENPGPDLAVALGASYYGLVKTGKGVRVGSGSPRAYYLAVSKKEDETKAVNHAVCLVERGLDEGSKIELKDKKFEVLTNQPVSFDVFSSSFRSGDRCGDLVKIDDSLSSLPPIQTIVQFGQKGVKKSIPVQIEAEYTEVGTLALWCRSLVSSHRWQLQFQLRAVSGLPGPAEVADREVFELSRVDSVCMEIRKVFSDKIGSNGADKAALDNLAKKITQIVERPREKWPLSFIRSVSDELLKVASAKNLSPAREGRWLNLAGFCMRPGFGDGFDAHRTKALWKLYSKGIVHSKNPQVRSEWWVLWRRVAGGLKPGQQRQFLQDLTPLMMPKKGAKVRMPPQERLEIWMAVANMEQLLVKDKIKWGRLLLSEMQPKKCRPQHFWSLARIGARELLYGPADRVIPPGEVSSWIEALLARNWQDVRPAGTALAQLARRTGDRMRDVDHLLIEKIIDWMTPYAFLASELKFLQEVVPMARQEESALFGESLPAGIVLHVS